MVILKKQSQQIGTFARIKKNLTTHIARHTFATTILLDNDVPLETTSKLLGHNSVRSTQIYAKVSLKKLSNNMSVLKSKLFPENDIAKTGSYFLQAIFTLGPYPQLKMIVRAYNHF